MCGIAGVVYLDPSRPVEPRFLKAMGDAIAHRGPDAEGYWSRRGVGLVHRRLSIIDLAGGDQPIANEDGSVQLVFNGEIYNYQELRAGLVERGHRLRTQSDTEVIVHLYEEQGERLVEHLRGMFAFALWDRKRGQLLLARDRLGIKPLYILQDDEKLLFGSELKAILAYPGVPREIDPAALEDYLAFGMVPGPRSIFRGIEKLQAAHTLVLRRESWTRACRRYWQLRFEPDERPNAHAWQEAVQAKLYEAVRQHLIADVPVGGFLSGGLDSSIVIANAARASAEPLATFCIGFREDSFCELPFARQVSEHFGTRHEEEIATPDAVSLVDRLTHYYDEPFADSSAIPTYLVSRLARRSVKVALSGDGGDEAFGGYARYAHDLREAALRRCLPGWFRRRVLGPLAGAWPKADWLPRWLRAKTTLTNLSLDPPAAYANTLAACRAPLRRGLLAPDLSAALNGHEPEQLIRERFERAPAGDPLAGMLAADVDVVLADDFLVKVDRASMAHGLEVRPPLLDHELLELAARIPSRFKVRDGETKWLVKEAYRERLPESAVSRAKRGFDMPIDGWLRGPLRQVFADAVLDPHAPIGSLVNLDTVRRLQKSHLAGIGRHGAVLWSVLVLACWSRRYLTAGAQSAADLDTVLPEPSGRASFVAQTSTH
jgi:asparagine synthase (glutamine-hydrolysing)